MNIESFLTKTGRIEGKVLAKDIRRDVKRCLKTIDRPPVLFLVAIDPPTQTRVYMNMKQRLASRLGIVAVQKVFTKDHSLLDIKNNLLDGLKNYPNLKCSIVVQLPVPLEFSMERIMELIPCVQDPDLLLKETREKWLTVDFSMLFAPPVAAAVSETLKYIGIWSMLPKSNYKIVVVGSGWLVGSPVSKMLTLHGVNHCVVSLETSVSKRKDLLKEADILISGAGDPWHITADMVKENVVVIDAGTMSVDGELRGDVHPGVYNKASVYTPVPGCIGPLSLACLMRNIALLAKVL
jgi:methylenetetrahydrofolate dehydrogenase (NADP+)/methenyltetrahydrofolate cyclohydrolase